MLPARDLAGQDHYAGAYFLGSRLNRSLLSRWEDEDAGSFLAGPLQNAGSSRSTLLPTRAAFCLLPRLLNPT